MANTFKNAATGSNSTITTLYECPVSTTAVIHAIYASNVGGMDTARLDISVSGSAFYNTRKHIMQNVMVPLDATVVIEKPINLGAGDKLETKAEEDGTIDVFASILEMT